MTFREYLIAQPVMDSPTGDLIRDMRKATDFPSVSSLNELSEAVMAFQARSPDRRRFGNYGKTFYPFVGLEDFRILKFWWMKYELAR